VLLLELFFFGAATGAGGGGGGGAGVAAAVGGGATAGRAGVRPPKVERTAGAGFTDGVGSGGFALGAALAVAASGASAVFAGAGGAGTSGGGVSAVAGALLATSAFAPALAAEVAGDSCMTLKAANAPPPRMSAPPPSIAAISGALRRFGSCMPVFDQLAPVERPTRAVGGGSPGALATTVETRPVTSALDPRRPAWKSRSACANSSHV